jgi:hypothetical protein
MMAMFAKALENLPPPDLQHTWAQAPVKFEDALGRIIPVPSEYDWDVGIQKLHTQFAEYRLNVSIYLETRGSYPSSIQSRSRFYQGSIWRIRIVQRTP